MMSDILERAKKIFMDELDAVEASTLEQWVVFAEANMDVLKEDYDKDVMVAFVVDNPDVRALAAKFGEYGQDPDILHLTLYYLGKVKDVLDLDMVKRKLELLAQTQSIVAGTYNGIGMLGGDGDKYPVVLLYDSVQMAALRVKLADAFGGLSDEQIHGFTPHTTVAWVPKDVTVQSKHINIPVTFSDITLYWGSEQYSYELTGTIIEVKQLPIDEAGKKRLIEVRRTIFNNAVDDLAEQVFSGDISIGQWEELMRAEIKAVHASVAAIKKGGWDAMTSQEWGRIGTPVREQYRYVHGFAEHIAANRDGISLKAIKARAHMYSEASGHTGNLILAGPDLESVLPWMPKDGSTKCLVNCKCQWTQTLVDTIGDYNLWQSVWELNPAEHCKDCAHRKGHTVVYRLHKNIPVPPIIGGY